MLTLNGVDRSRGPKKKSGNSATVAEIASEQGVPLRTANSRMALADELEGYPTLAEGRLYSARMQAGLKYGASKRGTLWLPRAGRNHQPSTHPVHTTGGRIHPTPTLLLPNHGGGVNESLRPRSRRRSCPSDRARTRGAYGSVSS